MRKQKTEKKERLAAADVGQESSHAREAISEEVFARTRQAGSFA